MSVHGDVGRVTSKILYEREVYEDIYLYVVKTVTQEYDSSPRMYGTKRCPTKV